MENSTPFLTYLLYFFAIIGVLSSIVFVFNFFSKKKKTEEPSTKIIPTEDDANSTPEHFISPSMPLWKIVLILFLLALLICGVYYSYKGYTLQVITILTIIIFFLGVVLVFVMLASKELFLWLIGKRSEFKRIVQAAQSVSAFGYRTVLALIPIGKLGITQEEKERLKDDIPMIVQMQLMGNINRYIMQVFGGLFAASFALLGTVALMQQNKLFTSQNFRIEQQTHLLEADRRSSYNFRLNNVFDRIDMEIKEQKEKAENKGVDTNSLKYELSDPLIGRIAALSQAFKPYKYMEGDSLIPNAISPERGQLLFALINSNLSSLSLKKIFEKVTFERASLEKIKLRGAYLGGADLTNADLKRADLTNADLKGAYLNGAHLEEANLRGAYLNRAHLNGAHLNGAHLVGANLEEADLAGADLKGVDLTRAYLIFAELPLADLTGADLRWADLTGADLTGANLRWTDLRGADLSVTKTLYKIRLDKPILDSLKQNYPHLFEYKKK